MPPVVSSASDRYCPNGQFSNALKSLGGNPLKFYEVHDPIAFHQVVRGIRDEDPFGHALSLYSPADYARMRTFISADGRSVFALDGDEIVSVGHAGEGNMAANSILQLATDMGGRRLNTFDTAQPANFSQMGFRAAARSPFRDDLAPEGSDEQTFRDFNGGRPDVVYMVWDPNNAARYNPTDGKLFTDPVRAQRAQVEKIRERYRAIIPKLKY